MKILLYKILRFVLIFISIATATGGITQINNYSGNDKKIVIAIILFMFGISFIINYTFKELIAREYIKIDEQQRIEIRNKNKE